MRKLNIAVIGAGLIGKVHTEQIIDHQDCQLCAIADPGAPGRDFAQENGIAWYQDLAEVLAANIADGVILATPNHMHVEQTLACIATGMPCLLYTSPSPRDS